VTLIAFVVSRSISSPIKALHRGSEIIGNGNLDYKVGTDTKDEIGELSRSLDEMTLRLKNSLITLENEITIRKSTEEELKLAHKELSEKVAKLEEANTQLNEYASVVSHDIRTPLRAIHNYADFLKEDLAEIISGDQKLYLDKLGTAVQQAEELISDLLELSRIGRHTIAVETINVGSYLEELIESLKLPEEVEIAMMEDWPKIDVEPIMFRQIFQNIIENAVKFNISSHKKVELGWRHAGDGYCEIFISDNGIGIEPRFHEQIFKVFERLHTQKEYDGTGIGLAIVKKAVSKLHGLIRVESKPGKGSTFFVKLPEIQKEIQI
jgi:light-regulated signal transduction histidine kinase (bacteriophytochrome)